MPRSGRAPTPLRRVIAIVAVTVLAVAAGVALERRSNALAHRVRRAIVTTLLWVLVPVVVWPSLVHLRMTSGAAAGLVVGAVGLIACGAAMGRLAGPLRLARPATGAAIVCTIQANTGFLGLPLCAALFSRAEFGEAVIYDTIVSLPMFAIGSFTVGALFGTAGGERSLRRRVPATLLSHPLIPLVAVALVAPDAWAPAWLDEPSRLAAYALAPLAFVVVGITLADEAQEGALRVPPPLTRPVAAVIALRMVAMPALVLAVSTLLIDLPSPYLLLAAMPAGINTIVVAHQTGLDLRLTVDAIVWTNAIALAGVAAYLAVVAVA